MSKVTIDGKRYDLSGMIHLNYSTRESGGVSVENVWYGPRSGRIIEETYSIWESSRHDGTCVGTRFAVYEPGTDEYGRMVEHLEREGCDLPEAPLPIVTE